MPGNISQTLGQFAPFVYLADLIVYRLLGLSSKTHIGDAVHFFILDVTKVFFLLTVIVFGVALLRSYFPPEKVRKILNHRYAFTGNIVAAAIGIVTPFCSCSAVPMFIGLLESGVPLGVTFSFLISAPTVNEVALVLLWGLFGGKIALLYMLTGLIIAVVSGLVIGELGLESQVEEYVYEIHIGETEGPTQTFQERADSSWVYTRDLINRIWPYVLVGIGLGAAIHGYVPISLVATYAGHAVCGGCGVVDRRKFVS